LLVRIPDEDDALVGVDFVFSFARLFRYLAALCEL